MGSKQHLCQKKKRAEKMQSAEGSRGAVKQSLITVLAALHVLDRALSWDYSYALVVEEGPGVAGGRRISSACVHVHPVMT